MNLAHSSFICPCQVTIIQHHHSVHACWLLALLPVRACLRLHKLAHERIAWYDAVHLPAATWSKHKRMFLHAHAVTQSCTPRPLARACWISSNTAQHGRRSRMWCTIAGASWFSLVKVLVAIHIAHTAWHVLNIHGPISAHSQRISDKSQQLICSAGSTEQFQVVLQIDRQATTRAAKNGMEVEPNICQIDILCACALLEGSCRHFDCGLHGLLLATAIRTARLTIALPPS